MCYSKNTFLGHVKVKASKYFVHHWIHISNTNNLMYYTRNQFLGHLGFFGWVRGQGFKIVIWYLIPYLYKTNKLTHQTFLYPHPVSSYARTHRRTDTSKYRRDVVPYPKKKVNLATDVWRFSLFGLTSFVNVWLFLRCLFDNAKMRRGVPAWMQ